MSDEERHTIEGIDRRRVLQGIGGAGIVSIAGCTSTTGETDEGPSGKLRFALVNSPIEFDPIVLNDVPSSQVVDRVVEGLYTYDDGTGIVPELAAGEPEVSDDGLQYVVEIADAATFSNGDPVTATDVKYSFEAPVAEETENASELNMIDTITVVDESTVQFDLKYPYGPFKTALTWSVVPKSVREQDKEAFNTGGNLVGSGPFLFDEWQEGQFARVVANEDYWGEPMPNLAEVEFVPVEEATTRVTTLQNGENDIVEEIPPKQYPTVRSISDAEIQEIPGIGYFYAAFNCNEGPTTDPQVREAIDYTFSMDQAVSNFVEPTGVRQYSPYPASIANDWDFPVDEWKGIPHDKDIAEAEALFEEAGVPSDYSFQIIVPPDDKREQIGITISNGIKEAGYDASVQRLQWGAFLDKYVTGKEDDYNIYTLGWSGTPDPDAFSYYLFGRDENTLGVTNGTYYGANGEAGKTVSDQIIEARQTADREARRQLYIEATTTLLEDRAHLPAYNLKNSFGVKNYVGDFHAHPVNSFTLSTDYNNVSLNE